ncbi:MULTISPECIES: ribbon-helix-helix domain-containing protein [unclassified Nostoc]|uniref:ribbon-helix-helix domain-containing protein n=1 Tax=unclassified Nostoc TaxID=2593658 RepID=UPI0025D31EA8|nr:type II toxin-antitoxin system ParD family antitoxin [Nostoc sp. JL33]MBN3872423.1 type II toxin-antitoxin system ParD family antitoxin [Nostoc sp. JL33]
MSISLTPDQERFIQTKLQSGKYRSAEEALEIALRLLDEYDRADAKWIEDVREKIDAAILASDKTPPIDGETFVNQVLERFRQGHQAQA